MKSQTILFAVLSGTLVASAGCSQTDPANPPPPSDSAETPEATPDPAADDGETPAEDEGAPSAETGDTMSAVKALLGARHTKDLPDKETLDKHPGADEALRELAGSADKMATRARALELLQHYPDEKSEALLVAVVTDDSKHRLLRAAALNGLATWDLSARDDIRSLFVERAEDPEVSISVAAVNGLRGVKEARSVLEAMSGRADDLPKPVRTAVEQALQ